MNLSDSYHYSDIVAHEWVSMEHAVPNHGNAAFNNEYLKRSRNGRSFKKEKNLDYEANGISIQSRAYHVVLTTKGNNQRLKKQSLYFWISLFQDPALFSKKTLIVLFWSGSKLQVFIVKTFGWKNKQVVAITKFKIGRALH